MTILAGGVFPASSSFFAQSLPALSSSSFAGPFSLHSSSVLSASNSSLAPSVLEWVVAKGVSLLQVESVCNQILKVPFLGGAQGSQQKYEDIHALSTLAQVSHPLRPDAVRYVHICSGQRCRSSCMCGSTRINLPVQVHVLHASTGGCARVCVGGPTATLCTCLRAAVCVVYIHLCIVARVQGLVERGGVVC